mgnify:FL=1
MEQLLDLKFSFSMPLCENFMKSDTFNASRVSREFRNLLDIIGKDYTFGPAATTSDERLNFSMLFLNFSASCFASLS